MNLLNPASANQSCPSIDAYVRRECESVQEVNQIDRWAWMGLCDCRSLAPFPYSICAFHRAPAFALSRSMSKQPILGAPGDLRPSQQLAWLSPLVQLRGPAACALVQSKIGHMGATVTRRLFTHPSSLCAFGWDRYKDCQLHHCLHSGLSRTLPQPCSRNACR